MQTQAVIEHITQWLKSYAEGARAKGFVVGVSGGIDSAVVPALAARTGLNTLLLEMPIRQKADQIDRAQLHIENLQQRFANVSGLRVDLTPTFEQFAATVDANEADFPPNSWRWPTRARAYAWSHFITTAKSTAFGHRHRR